MHLRLRVATAGAVVFAAGCVLSSCAGSPSKNADRATTTTAAPTTSTSSTPSTTTTTTTTLPGVTVPNVIGLKIVAAHATLHRVGLPAVGLNAPCNKGTLASQSVVASLAIAGKEPDVRVGAVPLNPGAAVPPGTRIGITWSGCYGDASAVPSVVGLTFPAARHALHVVGLTWACYSVGKPPTTTTTSTTTVKSPRLVLTQSPVAGTVLHPGATVALTMHACPQ